MTVRAFFDGSGSNAKNSDSRYLTLGVYFGTEESWPQLERDWIRVLEDSGAPTFNGAPYFHAKEAMHATEGYQGWKREAVVRLANQLLNALAQTKRDDLIGVSCTIDRDEYKSAKRKIPALRPMEHICLDFCLSVIFRHPKRDDGVELFFDRNEKFHGIVDGLWKKRERGRRIWWGPMVTQIGEVEDMRKVPAIQTADLLAWFGNRYWVKGNNDPWGGLYWVTFLTKAHFHAFVDEEAILEAFNPDGSMKENVQFKHPGIKFPGVE